MTALEGLEGQIGHHKILRVRLCYPNEGWVTMTGVDGQQILATPDKYFGAKMEDATRKLNEGQYKRAAMLFSSALDIAPEDKEANRGLVEAHKGIKLLMMCDTL